MGSVGSTGSTGAVRRIKIKKRRGVLEYMVFTKDEKPVNLLNLLTYEDSYKGKPVIFCFHTSIVDWSARKISRLRSK